MRHDRTSPKKGGNQANSTVNFLKKLRAPPWVLTAIHADKQWITTITAKSADDVRAFVSKWNGKRNIYYSVNPARTELTSKAKKTDIAAIEYLLSDLDPREDETSEAAKARYLSAVNKMKPQPTAVLDSGNGLQTLFKLANPILLVEPVTVLDDEGKPSEQFPEETQKIIDDVEDRTRLLMETLGGEAGTQNIDRILRLPGTINLPNAKKRKEGRTECVSKLILFNGATCSLDDFPAAASNDAPQQGHETTTEKEGVANTDEINHQLNFIEGSLPDDLMELIREGVEVGDRSDQFHHAVKSLKDEGVKLTTIIRLLKKYPEGIAERYLSEGRLVKQAKTVYGKPEEKKAKDKDDTNTKNAKSKAKLIQSSEEFTRGFVAPDYLWDGILLKGFVYCITAITGHGKTAIMLALVAALALGREFAGRDVEKCRVLYFAGENPDDVRMRWIAMAQHMNFEADFIDVSFISGTFDISKLEKKINNEVEALGGVSLVVIDTGPAFFQGESENDNVEMIAHAEMLRRLKDLPGKPTVLAATHPVKNAQKDNLVPRGGGGFLNAMDGNLCGWKEDMLVELHWQGKIRGTDFEPITFELEPVIARKLIDSKGRHIPTVIARDLDKDDQRHKKSTLRSDEDAILSLLMNYDRAPSYSDIAELLHWDTAKGDPNKSKVQRVMKGLVRGKLVEIDRDGATLTRRERLQRRR